jgi:FtsP/CotA-like multicopper oxidase with cupredoxin domain
MSSGKNLSRGRFLAASGGAGSLLALPTLLGASGPSMDMNSTDPGTDIMPIRRAPFTRGAALQEPEVRRSANGELRTTLRLQYSYRDIGGYRLYLRSYEGTLTGPTLRVRPGDVLRVRVMNGLPPNRDPMPAFIDQMHHINTTNFHSHGLHVSPSGISDNVFRSMEPGDGYDVEIAIPKNHPKGTYWYHPHHHGGSDVQIASGVAGALIVEGDFAEVPEIAAARERVMVLGESVFDAFGTVENFETLFPETAVRFQTINGQRAPVIAMRPGEVQRWRLVHAGYQDHMNLSLKDHAMHPIARDGISLARMEDPGATMLIAPGQRIDVLVKAGATGTYELRALPYDQGYPSPAGLVATVVVAGEPTSMKLPSELPPSPMTTIRDSEITGRRRLRFASTAPEVEATEHWQEFSFTVDGLRFDPNRVDQRVRLGSVEEWTIVNEHVHDHVFHIHVNPFQVVNVNGKPVTDPMWLDTAILQRNGSFTFRTRFEDFTGRYVLHCHMMNHEEMGMMQVVEVYS